MISYITDVLKISSDGFDKKDLKKKKKINKLIKQKEIFSQWYIFWGKNLHLEVFLNKYRCLL